MALKHTPETIVSDGHVVITGTIRGTVTTSDGTVYDVTPNVIEVASPEHAGEVAHAVSVRYEDEASHPLHANSDVPFVHVCHAGCGKLRRSEAETLASLETRADTNHDDYPKWVEATKVAHQRHNTKKKG